MFLDHAVSWARHWLGDEEFDRRLSVLQPCVGFWHFQNGFTQFKQHTGREQRDLERVFLAVIAGHPNVNQKIMFAMRGYLDFIYLGQYPSHSSGTLQYLEQALRHFHRYNHAISESGVHNGPRRQGKFNIKKLELMQHVPRLIKLLGAADQFTTDQTERCHITMAKTPYRATNKKDFNSQMCRFNDREEKVNLFSGWLEWKESTEIELQDSHPIMHQLHSFDHTDGLLKRVNKFQTVNGVSLAPIQNYFKTSSLTPNITTAFHIPTRVTARNVNVGDVPRLYGIRGFEDALHEFTCGRDSSKAVGFKNIDVWSSIRMQCFSQQDQDIILPPQTVQALQPSSKLPFCRCNVILIRGGAKKTGDIQGHFLGQIRLIFRSKPLSKMESPSILLYVECFKPAPGTYRPQRDGTRAFVPDDNIEMYRVIRALNSNGTRKGVIISLQDVWRPVELIPVFEKACPLDWTCDNSLELATQFYLNCFSDKDIYKSVY